MLVFPPTVDTPPEFVTQEAVTPTVQYLSQREISHFRIFSRHARLS
jgi:hypothetical protein